jgi:hypothetical protein
MGVWQGVAMNSLKFHLGMLWSTLVCPAGGLPLMAHLPSSTPLDTPRCMPKIPLCDKLFHPILVVPCRWSLNSDAEIDYEASVQYRSSKVC